MAKRRKKRTLRRSKGRSGFGRSWLNKQMAEVEGLYEAGAYHEAFELLLTVVEKYPRHAGLLDRLIDIAAKIENWRAVVTYSERLYPMQKGHERAVTLNNLKVAYIKLMLPTLSWHTACMLLADHPDFELSADVQSYVQRMEVMLVKDFQYFDLLSEKFDGDRAKVFAFMVEHDRMTFSARTGQSKETILRGRRLLAKVPEFMPALNSLSLAYFAEEDIKSAIETTQQALAVEPEDHHARSNLARYSFLMGETDAAWEHATGLMSLEGGLSNRWSKHAETFAYLGDDEAVRTAYLQAEQYEWLKTPLLLHLGAAAHYRLGDEAKAWALWEEALRIDPTSYMAQASLADRAKAPHERDVGWYWPLNYWFPGNFNTSLQKFLPNTHNERTVKVGVKKLLKKYPQLPALAPHILDRGDSEARKTLLSLILSVPIPELSHALLAYGLGRHGADAQRVDALHVLAQSDPDLLPADRKVLVWSKGQQKETLVLGFHIDYKQHEQILDDKTHQLFLKAHQYFYHPQDPQQAERLLTEIINAYPDFRPAYNQLGVVYELQGRHKKKRALIKQMILLFPDDIFARTTLARSYLHENRIDEAREVLNAVLQQKTLHVTEVRALAQAEIAFALTTERAEWARAWLEVWEKAEGPHHPDIATWKAHIEQNSNSARKRRLAKRKK